MMPTEPANIWQWVAEALEHHDAIMLLVVVSSEGSSPGKAGAKMAVTEQGECYGTIGGGAVENKLCQQAQSMLSSGSLTPRLIRQQHSFPATSQASGMACGGAQSVLLFCCQNSDLKLYRQLAAADRTTTPGILSLSPVGIQFNPQQTLPYPTQFNQISEQDWIYQEIIGISKQAYLIGGGHVSLALSKILATLDFGITVIDERDTPDTLIRNNDAHRKLVIPYREISNVIPEGDQIFVLIMTHSHKMDAMVVEQLAGKNLHYLGVLGSRKKISQLKTYLGGKLTPESLQRIKGPIGLPIHSHTPAEIAVSIAAELIQLQNTVN